MKVLKSYFSLLLVFICLSISWKLKLLVNKPSIVLSKESTAFNLDSTFLSIFSFGQKRLYSDILWITTLLESDIVHVKDNKKDSWMFLRFKTILDLDPLFLMNYKFGGQYLSIIKDDLKGAEYIYNKGLQAYPEDFDLLFNFAFLQAIEIQNFEKAISLYKRIQFHPRSPNYISSLIAKLTYSKNGSLDEVFMIVQDMYKNTKNKRIKLKLENDLYAIKAEIDLKCLNSSGIRCDQRDFHNDKYKLKDGTYFSSKPFTKYKLNIKGSR
jgi:hypothetical protein